MGGDASWLAAYEQRLAQSKRGGFLPTDDGKAFQRRESGEYIVKMPDQWTRQDMQAANIEIRDQSLADAETAIAKCTPTSEVTASLLVTQSFDRLVKECERITEDNITAPGLFHRMTNALAENSFELGLMMATQLARIECVQKLGAVEFLMGTLLNIFKFNQLEGLRQSSVGSGNETRSSAFETNESKVASDTTLILDQAARLNVHGDEVGAAIIKCKKHGMTPAVLAHTEAQLISEALAVSLETWRLVAAKEEAVRDAYTPGVNDCPLMLALVVGSQWRFYRASFPAHVLTSFVSCHAHGEESSAFDLCDSVGRKHVFDQLLRWHVYIRARREAVRKWIKENPRR